MDIQNFINFLSLFMDAIFIGIIVILRLRIKDIENDIESIENDDWDLK